MNFDKALIRFDMALKAPIDLNQLMIEASIKCFSYCYELTWKVLKDVLEKEGSLANTPREVFQQVYGAHLISEESLWLAMLADRSMASHAYDKEVGLKIYGRLKEYYSAMYTLRALVRNKIDEN